MKRILLYAPCAPHYAQILCTAISILAVLQGYQFGLGDLSTYVPFILHEYDSSLFANDLLIETIRAHPVYVWKFLSVFLHWIGVEILFKYLFFNQVALTALAVWWFYREIFGRDYGWILLLLMLVISKRTPGMGVFGLGSYHYFHPGAVSFALGLTIYVLLQRRLWMVGGGLTGLLYLFHPFTAVFMSMTYVSKLMFELKESRRRDVIFGSMLLVAFAAPSWYPFLSHFIAGQEAAFDKELWLALVEMRMEKSFFISAWVIDRYFHVAAILAILFLFRKKPVFKSILPIIAATLAALLLKGTAEVFEVKFLLQLQLARCSYFIYFLAGAFIANKIANMKERIRPGDVPVLLGGYFMMIYPAVENGSGVLPWLMVAIALLTVGIVSFKQIRGWRIVYTCLGLGLILISTAGTVYATYRDTGRIYDHTGTSPWGDIQLWCRSNIPKDEVLMTPFYNDGFRSLSHRSIYGSFKDGAPHNYSNETFFRWWERMAQFGLKITPNPDRREFRILYHRNAAAVARSAGLRYLIYDKQWVEFSGPILYENDGFGLIDLNRVANPEFRFRD